jgi:heme A synthase
VNTKLVRYAWSVLLYNVLVILWGAYVRATGSGAGCGAHWPLCNGEVIPSAPGTKMLVEFSHRLTSGLALLAVVVLLVWVYRACGKGHPARRGAAWAMFFVLTEAAVGAGLVLFQLVADNASMARAMFMAVHQVNTFALLACLALTAYWAAGGADITFAGRRTAVAIIVVAVLGMIGVGKSGAIAALGDTLYPATSLSAAFAADVSASSQLLIRLRLLHPAIAIAVVVLLSFGSASLKVPAGNHIGARAKRAVPALAWIQLLGGFLNVWLLAPVWMQMVHLLLADALWVSLILLSAAVLAKDRDGS